MQKLAMAEGSVDFFRSENSFHLSPGPENKCLLISERMLLLPPEQQSQTETTLFTRWGQKEDGSTAGIADNQHCSS